MSEKHLKHITPCNTPSAYEYPWGCSRQDDKTGQKKNDVQPSPPPQKIENQGFKHHHLHPPRAYGSDQYQLDGNRAVEEKLGIKLNRGEGALFGAESIAIAVFKAKLEGARR